MNYQNNLYRRPTQPPVAPPVENDPWAGYQDTLDLESPASEPEAPTPPVVENDFTAAAARLVQRQNALAEAAKKAADEAKAKAAEKKEEKK